jgi:microfibrillar-associated protein 1
MEKVKVTRYISGRRPEYAQSESESESSEDEEGFVPMGEAEEEEFGEGLPEEAEPPEEIPMDHVQDRRLQRLQDIQGARAGVGRLVCGYVGSGGRSGQVSVWVRRE